MLRHDRCFIVDGLNPGVSVVRIVRVCIILYYIYNRILHLNSERGKDGKREWPWQKKNALEGTFA